MEKFTNDSTVTELINLTKTMKRLNNQLMEEGEDEARQIACEMDNLITVADHRLNILLKALENEETSCTIL